MRTRSEMVEVLRSRGLHAEPIAAAVEAIEMDDWRARTTLGSVLRAGRVFRARAPLDALDLERAIAALGPDAVLVDVNAWGGLAAAEAWGGAWGVTCPFPLTLPSRFGPPMGPGLRPLGGRLGRLRDRSVAAAMEAVVWPPARAALTPPRAERGLPPLRESRELLLAPPLVLYASAEPFEYRRPDWPASVVMVGPWAWEPPGGLPAELAGVTAPLVLVTGSTEFQDDASLAATAFEALAEDPVHVVATVPSAESSRLRPPANGTVLGFTPHGPILERAACAVTHGGMGVTQKALSRGVPVCAVPFGRDQYEVARRVEANGAGTRLPAPRLSPKRLRRAVRAAMGCGRRGGADGARVRRRRRAGDRG
ncbi:MAG TPA: nucleotide disphospho-sugar-binding domain-containing protein [Solirubrobacterales bacterium]|nr:nucleotide disphospho-sugar-binding domain-containing protein [Solirubrobacterales bacterium]